MSHDPSVGVPLTRRALLVASAAAGGGLLIGWGPRPALAAAGGPSSDWSPNAFVRVGKDGAVTAILPYVEMGQGAYTSQVQLLAEELEVDPAKVRIEAAPPDEKRYGSPLFGGQITGGSGSLRGSWATLRAAGAAARTMLVQAAAQQWRVPEADCAAVDGEVVHRASGRKLRFGALTEAAATLPVPANPALKTPANYRVIGKSVRRVDTPAKVTGVALYGIDVRLPGLRHAAVHACPVFGGKLANVDSTQAMKVRGVSQVVQLADAVAVIGDTSWAARKGLNALKIEWDPGANSGVSTPDLVAQADAALERNGLVAVNQGDVAAAEARAASKYDATFRLPALAHAGLEPLNCTVHLQSGACEVWCGSQVLGRAQQAAAEAAGVALDRVTVHNLLLGGGFGRRLETDYVSQAVLIAKQVNAPVKVTWSREEDMQHDYYRFHNHSRVTVGLDAAGRPISWRHRVVGPNIMARWLPVYQKDGVDLDVVDQASGPYDIPDVFIDFVRNEAPEGMRTGNWRGVGVTRNVFVVERVIDDLAAQARVDPVSFRRSLMTKAPRTLATLDLAAAQFDPGETLPKGRGRGVAVFSGFGSHFSVIAQVQVSDRGAVRVERVVCAADVGLAVNPDIVKAQIEGGIVYGISAALYGRITVEGGRIVQANYDTYPVLRMNESPRIDVHLVASDADPGGVGEPGTSGAIAAVTNAVCAATGHRIYELPLDPVKLRSKVA